MDGHQFGRLHDRRLFQSGNGKKFAVERMLTCRADLNVSSVCCTNLVSFFQELTETEKKFMYENEMNLQSAAANIGYEYASRGFCGSSVKPEPETFDEAVVQLLDEKEKEATTSNTNQEPVTAEQQVIHVRSTVNIIFLHIRSTVEVFSRSFPLTQQISFKEEEMEAFGDYDDATLKRLAAKKERTKAEEQKFKTLSQLRYIKTRTIRSRERRLRTVMDDSEKIESFMGQESMLNTPLPHKLPDFKLRQITAYHTKDENSAKKMVSPYALLTNPEMTEEEFMKRFKENKPKEDNK